MEYVEGGGEREEMNRVILDFWWAGATPGVKGNLQCLQNQRLPFLSCFHAARASHRVQQGTLRAGGEVTDVEGLADIEGIGKGLGGRCWGEDGEADSEGMEEG